MKQAILGFAEREIRKSGFDAVSFRDIAKAVGIKSASVHYHFPTKADLARAVVTRYTEEFIEGLNAQSEEKSDVASKLTLLADHYLASYQAEHSTCLCAVLGATPGNLPPDINSEVRHFYEQLLEWTSRALSDAPSKLTPEMVVSTLQGAMILSVAQNSPKALEDAKNMLIDLERNL